MWDYIERVGIAISQLFNVVCNGKYNETFSARMYREENKIGIKIINSIFFWQNHHCRGSYNHGRKRMKEYLKKFI